MHTISRVKRVKDDKWLFQPDGFNNNILWHAGHIFVIVETFLHNSMPTYDIKNPEWIALFDDGTNPKEWPADMPSGEEVLTALREQLDWVIPFIEDKMDQDASEPLVIGDDIMTIRSIEGIVQFLSWHEGTHAGTIFALNALE